jgi:hypothetical protein
MQNGKSNQVDPYTSQLPIVLAKLFAWNTDSKLF